MKSMVDEENLPHILKLLDDTEPAIQQALRQEFSDTNGDLSHEIAALAIDLSPREHRSLSTLLQPGRRETLIQEWQVPQGGADALNDDWDRFEDLMRLICDFLHDGVTLRPTLPDMLDILEEDARSAKAHLSEDQLRIWMFESGRFVGNKENYYTPANSDLCHCIDSGYGNPISLALLFIMLGRRLNLEVSGCNYPGHFLARINVEGSPMLVDCFHKGRLISVETILSENKNISEYAKQAILVDAPLGHILLRTTRNLEHAFKKLKRPKDADLFLKLFNSLHH